jgi:hypothetical protein
VEHDAIREWHAYDRSGRVSGYDLGTPYWSADYWYASGQMNLPGPPSQPGAVHSQNAQDQPTWISGTQQSQKNNILAPPPPLPSFAGTSVPPLDRIRFQASYRHFCLTKKLAIYDAALNIGGKQVDLHTLHEEVLKLRATGRVSFTLSNPTCVC